MRVCNKKGFVLKYLANDSKRVTAKCRVEGYEFRVYRSWTRKNKFMLRGVKGEHTCFRPPINKELTANWVYSKYLELTSDDSFMKVSVLKSMVHRDTGYWITDALSYRVKKMVVENIHGGHLEQFGCLGPMEKLY